MNISEAAQACGLPTKTIRYYESIGLVVPKRQEANEYRVYSFSDIEQLRFLQRARAVGFSLEDCRQLLSLYLDPSRRSADVREMVSGKIAQVDQQLIALNAIRATLVGIVNECANNDASDFAIIDFLAGAREVMDTEISTNSGTKNMPFTLVEQPNE